MDFYPASSAHFKDGASGTVERVIFNPIAKSVTHLAVKLGHLGEVRLVPVSEVSEANEKAVELLLTEDEYHDCPPFIEFQFVPYGDKPEVLSDIAFVEASQPFTLAWPFVSAGTTIPIKVERVPPGELSFGRGTAVDASDGHIGHVGAFVVDPKTGQLTHLVLRQGHFWGRREVSVPLSSINRFEGSRVVLDLSKDQVEALPTLVLDQ